MPKSDALDESLKALSGFLVGESKIDDTAQRVVELAQQGIGAASMAGITMSVKNKPHTPFFTNKDAVEIDDVQYEADGGPCLDSFRTGEIVRVDSMDTETRWPEFVESARRHGIKSTLSLPLLGSDRSIGALNLYAVSAEAFDDHAEETGVAFAQQAAVVLANAQTYWDLHDLHTGLQEATKSRAVIEQAKGILMARSHVDADRAFEILREASQRANRKLRDIAQDLVEQTTLKED